MGKAVSKDVPLDPSVEEQETRSELRNYLETLSDIANTGQIPQGFNPLNPLRSGTSSSFDHYDVSSQTTSQLQEPITIPQIRVLSLKQQDNCSGSLPEQLATDPCTSQEQDCQESSPLRAESSSLKVGSGFGKNLSARRKLFKKASSADDSNLQRKTVKRQHLFRHSAEDNEMQSSQEWDNMQEWMTWCIHHHLSQDDDDDDDDVSIASYPSQRHSVTTSYPSQRTQSAHNRRRLERQMSFDKTPSNLLSLKSHSQGTSSFESTSDGRTVSNQNSFDSNLS